jgi:hypothetical protein
MQPLKSANMHEVVQEWYANFVNVDQEILFELILAANYMDIKPLLDLTCATVASMIKGDSICSCIPHRNSCLAASLFQARLLKKFARRST